MTDKYTDLIDSLLANEEEETPSEVLAESDLPKIEKEAIDDLAHIEKDGRGAATETTDAEENSIAKEMEYFRLVDKKTIDAMDQVRERQRMLNAARSAINKAHKDKIIHWEEKETILHNIGKDRLSKEEINIIVASLTDRETFVEEFEKVKGAFIASGMSNAYTEVLYNQEKIELDNIIDSNVKVLEARLARERKKAEETRQKKKALGQEIEALKEGLSLKEFELDETTKYEQAKNNIVNDIRTSIKVQEETKMWADDAIREKVSLGFSRPLTVTNAFNILSDPPDLLGATSSRTHS